MLSGSRFLPLSALVLLSSAAVSLPSEAQLLKGTVVDDSTRRPLERVAVLAIAYREGRIVGSAVTTGAGTFSIKVPQPGTYALRFDGQGYKTLVSEPIAIDANMMAVLDIRLMRGVAALPPIIVLAEAVPIYPGPIRDFERRRRMGHGHFITMEEIEKRNPIHFSDLFYGIPGVRVIRRSDVSRTIRMTTEAEAVDAANTIDRIVKQAPQKSGFRPMACVPLIYQDGTRLGRADDVIDLVNVREIYGVELYTRASQIPVTYSGNHSRCGVVVVWTRRGPRNH